MLNKTQRKKKKRSWPFLLIFILGLGLMSYPLISRYYYRVEVTELNRNFDREARLLSSQERDERIELAHFYNESLSTHDLSDPFAKERIKLGQDEYARMLLIHEQMGHIRIPKMAVDLPIYAGTSEDVLQKGCGHMPNTSLPVGGNNTHAVITAHRGLPGAKLFNELNLLQEGDKFYVHNLKEVLAYQVDQIKIISPEDFSDLLVAPGHDYVTLLTCHPYMINSHRLIVRGHRVPYSAAVAEREMEEHKVNNRYRYLFYLSLVFLLILTYLLYKKWRHNRRLKQRLAKLAAEQAPKAEEGAESSGVGQDPSARKRGDSCRGTRS